MEWVFYRINCVPVTAAGKFLDDAPDLFRACAGLCGKGNDFRVGRDRRVVVQRFEVSKACGGVDLVRFGGNHRKRQLGLHQKGKHRAVVGRKSYL